MKPPAMSLPRNDQIPNKNINTLGTKTDKSLPTQYSKYCTGYKSLIHEAEDDPNDSANTSRNDKEYSVNNLKAINNKNIDDK